MEHARSWRHTQCKPGYKSKKVCSTVLSETAYIAGNLFPFLHEGRVFLITLRGAGVALSKIGFACKGNHLLQRGPSYIGRYMVAVD